MSDYSLDWRGDDVKRMVEENIAKAMGEFGLTVEGEAKSELQKGHGVETGTLRRSIHTAKAGYDWSKDGVGLEHPRPLPIGPVGPNRGDSEVTPTASSGKLTIEVGSGLVYAMAVHQGHHGFQGYHYLTNALNKAQGKLDGILAKYKVQR